MLFLAIFLLILTQTCYCSLGDRVPFYQKCIEKCALSNCTSDAVHFLDNRHQPLYLQLFFWNCEDECRYECMWNTVNAFHEHNYRTPQFHGKWPFIRILGVQEPASAAFSMLNFYSHSIMLRKFRREVPGDSPLYWLWHSFALVNLNAWIWSTIFHIRDFPLTEFMDYACASSVIFVACYTMIIRLLKESPRFLHVTITTFCVAFFANHVAYLGTGRFDYGYNMKLNVVIGSFTAICWFGWSVYNRLRQPYVWKCAIFIALTGLVMLLEIIDMPPLLYTFDCHAFWHLATAPLICLFYSFIIEDCNYLRKEVQFQKSFD